MLGFSTARGGALRASVGSTEATWDQSTPLCRPKRATRLAVRSVDLVPSRMTRPRSGCVGASKADGPAPDTGPVESPGATHVDSPGFFLAMRLLVAGAPAVVFVG